MKTITLTNYPLGTKVAKVSDTDHATLSGFIWAGTKDRHGVLYATTRIGTGKKKKRITMHRMVMGFPKKLVDHEDGDGLNNQRDNLREATHSENMGNCRRHRDNGSKYKGVTHDNQGNTKRKWRAHITVDGKRTWLGRFTTAKAAALAYDDAAIKAFKEFAKPNFPIKK